MTTIYHQDHAAAIGDLVLELAVLDFQPVRRLAGYDIDLEDGAGRTVTVRAVSVDNSYVQLFHNNRPVGHAKLVGRFHTPKDALVRLFGLPGVATPPEALQPAESPQRG